MKIEEYSELALRTASRERPLLHAALGLADETGEIIGPIKKHLFYGKNLDMNNLKEEAGDLAWFLNLLIHAIGSSWDEVLGMNITKLEKRYPHMRFNADHAIHRDTAAEKAAMEGA